MMHTKQLNLKSHIRSMPSQVQYKEQAPVNKIPIAGTISMFQEQLMTNAKVQKQRVQYITFGAKLM